MPNSRSHNLDDLIALWSSHLHTPPSLNPVAVLKAIAMRESRYGLLTTPRQESSYLMGGRNCNDAQIRRLSHYGAPAACSYSSWQIMFPVACELGYTGDPHALDEDREAIHWVVELLNRRAFGRDHASTIEEVGDAYNSGSCRDRFQPIAYMQAVAQFYHDVVASPQTT